MTIDEKIKQAADKYKRMLVPQDGYMTQRCFIAGADFLKSEMLADMQKLIVALEFYANNSTSVWDCNGEHEIEHDSGKARQALAEFNAKYKGEK